MSPTNKAVIFDYSTLLIANPAHLAELRAGLVSLKSRGVRVVAFSTHKRNLSAELVARRLPDVDLFLTKEDVGAAKGSPAWIDRTASTLGIERHKLFYIGDDALDWRTAINCGVMYLHAKWSVPNIPVGVTAYGSASPATAFRFLSHFFLPEARWGYKLDDEELGLHARALLNANHQLACDESPGNFALQTIFTYGNSRMVGSMGARNLLMLHALANLYAEGLIIPGVRFAVYPNSTPGTHNQVFTEYLEPAAKMFHGWLHDGILSRREQAPDTSRLRAKQQHSQVSFLNQSNTVCVDRELRSHFEQKSLIVFDDFTTDGMAFEWARNLLRAAGATKVVLVAFGKYGQRLPVSHTVFEPSGIRIDPFGLYEYSLNHFTSRSVPYTFSDLNIRITQEMFRKWQAREMYVST
jgi:hypothetical protein